MWSCSRAARSDLAIYLPVRRGEGRIRTDSRHIASVLLYRWSYIPM